MPEPAADYHARIRSHGDADGRLALPWKVSDENVDAGVDHLVSGYGGERARG